MIVQYKLKSGDYFSDLAMGMSMFLKGKIKIISPRTRDVKSVRNIFKHTGR
jgi:hypothetical protein